MESSEIKQTKEDKDSMNGSGVVSSNDSSSDNETDGSEPHLAEPQDNMFTPQEANEEKPKSGREEKKTSVKNDVLSGKGFNDIQQFIAESCTKAEDGLKKKKTHLGVF